MKILFAGMAKLKYMPYIRFYLNQIDCKEHEVHISYWDRDGKEDCEIDENISLHCFRCDMNDGDSLKKKMPRFLKYRKHLIRVIKKTKPDLLIVHYQTTGVIIYDYLTRKYKGNFILDYRDVTYERISFFKKMVAKLVDSSYATFISSNGFRPFLPKSEKIYISHNINKEELFNRAINLPKKNVSDKIRISFWGLIRHLAINKAIIEKIGNDDRFELHYYGRADGEMLTLLNNSVEKYSNVWYHGEYLANQRVDFAKNTDILHNIYDNGDKTAPIAMGNKFYDGLLFGVPQLCMRDSLMGTLCMQYQIGWACNPFDDDFADQLYNYYNALDRKVFQEASNKFLQDIMSDIRWGEKIVDDFLSGKGKM